MVEGFFDQRSNTISYIVYRGRGSACAVLDPVLDFDPRSGHTNEATVDLLIDFIRRHELRLEWILETHIHHDHLSGAGTLKGRIGGRLGIGEHARSVVDVVRRTYNLTPEVSAFPFDHLFSDGETFHIGELTSAVIYTPGHTTDSISYRIGDAVFVGDVLFMPDYGTGRCDFYGGDAAALYRSVQSLLALPADTRVFVCHDYCPGGRAPAWETTIRQQRTQNVHLRNGTTEEAFIRLRGERDRGLAAPVLLLPSLQVNIRGGRLPPPEANGTTYLKLPVNVPVGTM